MRNFNNNTSSRGGSRFGQPSKFGQQAQGFGGRPQRGRFNRRSARLPKNLEISKLINKATPIEESVFTPVHTFQEFPFHPTIKANIALKGYNKLTPIQDQAIAHIIAGKDTVGIANTGTGKTAAFLLPLINKVVNNRNEKILILAPTRELAQQIFEEFVVFSKGLNIHGSICVGGVHVGAQISALRRNPNFVIATPGRLKDLANRRLVNLKFFNTVVLDEADRMVDMGFIQDIKAIIAMLPPKRHSLFFSATISKEIHALIQQFLVDPVTVSVKFRETASNVDQDIIRVTDSSRKIDILKGLLAKSEFSKVLIFGRTKRGVEKLSVILSEKGFKVASIHSNKSQSSRQKALNLFKQNSIKILVATDVAARGLDISEVSHVINYDMPATYDDYIHRIGRTGRADKIGKALTFVE
ncbi:MAG: DEAD/DEAH box helicase [Candidatus Gracilibacteria bacterium]